MPGNIRAARKDGGRGLERKYSVQRMQQARQGGRPSAISIAVGRSVGRSAPGSNRSDDFPASEPIPFSFAFLSPGRGAQQAWQPANFPPFFPLPPVTRLSFFLFLRLLPFPIFPLPVQQSEGRKDERAKGAPTLSTVLSQHNRPPVTFYRVRTGHGAVLSTESPPTVCLVPVEDLLQDYDSHRIHPDKLMRAFICGQAKPDRPLTNFLLLVRFPSLRIYPELRRM